MNKRLVFPVLVLAFGCTAAQRPAAAPALNPQFKNVRVLPQTMSRDELLVTMRRFTQALGVGCDYCHAAVPSSGPRPELDFPSDAKSGKRIARVMIQMTQQINGAWLDRVEDAAGAQAAAAAPDEHPDSDVPRVNCWTCHRGRTDPEMPPPVPPRK